MNRPIILMLVIVVMLSFTKACKPDFTTEHNVVSTMLGVLKKVEDTSNEVDARLVKQYLKDVSEKCAKIQAEMTDTISIEDAQILVDFCALSEHFQSCLDRKELIDSEIVATRNQLYDLQTDLKERRADEDSVNNYIEGEFLYVESLDEGTERVLVELNGCFETYSELKEEIDRLLISLPSKDSQ